MNDDVFRKIMGAKLAGFRKDARLSQRALGEILGIGQSTISQFEKGTRGIPPDRIPELADALGIDEGELREESLSPEEIGKSPGEYVLSVGDIEEWRTRVLMDRSLEPGTQLILALLAAPAFLNRRSWMVLTTIDQFIRETGRSRDLVESHWDAVISSPYVEREGEVEWSFWLKFPE